MSHSRLILFFLVAGFVHLVVLASVPHSNTVSHDSGGSLRVTFLAPQTAVTPPKHPATSHPTARVAPDGTRPVSTSTHDLNRDDAPTTALASPLSSPSEADVRGRQIRILLDRAVQASFHYPLIAQRQGWQGEVRIALTIRADGFLDNIRISRSSGYDILDDAALESVRRIRAVPAAVAALDGTAIDLVLPVRYQLRRS